MHRDKFDIFGEFRNGTTLIEASAGTGKTTTIVRLFLRLLVEKEIPVEKILVVTFTEAATEELKDRIRKMLKFAHGVFSGDKTGDEFLNKYFKLQKNPESVRSALQEAIRSFDQSSIYTIHGFSRKMLLENAFESGIPFDTELITDEYNFRKEIVEDFFRKELYSASKLFSSYAISKNFTPENLVRLACGVSALFYVKIIPEPESVDFSPQELLFVDSFAALKDAWILHGEQVTTILLTAKGLNRNKYKEAIVQNMTVNMDAFCSLPFPEPVVFENFEKFCTGFIGNSINKGGETPVHPFFDLCENFHTIQKQLTGLYDKKIKNLKVALFRSLQNELPLRKVAKNIQSFDDLLLNLKNALIGETGDSLSSSIREKFKAALIDEFQDTDPVQYEIFNKIFGAPSESILFLIGDPKQAIYGWRGADVFAYMIAADEALNQFTLDVNYRSEPGLVRATNTIFSNVSNPFIYDKIPFQEVRDSGSSSKELMHGDDYSKSPFQIRYLLDHDNKVITKSHAHKQIISGVISEIMRLLELGRNSRIKIGDRGLAPGDIAVLVRKNLEAQDFQKELSKFKIPTVIYMTGNLFDTWEALELERVLNAVADPRNEKLLRIALGTDMIGFSGEELEQLIDDDSIWEQWLVKFREYQNLWIRYGFMRMFKTMVSKQGILKRLMVAPNGERRNTNILHLGEMLHQVSHEQKLGVMELINWLSSQRLNQTENLDEYQLRLESDEKALKIVTIHKSKGLEYPVVFCPFIWDGIRKNNELIFFHSEEKDRQLMLDLGSAGFEINRELNFTEQQAENLRLLYVALTRARNRCYLVWGRIRDAETSAPAHVLHVNGISGSDNNSKFLEELRNVVSKSDRTISIGTFSEIPQENYIDSTEPQTQLECRKFSSQVTRSWSVASFSSLTQKELQRADERDRDALDTLLIENREQLPQVQAEEKPAGIFAFPRGIKAGIFLHSIFENLDFENPFSPAFEPLLLRKIKESGFDLSFVESIKEMVQKTLSCPLDAESSDMLLSRIHRQQRLHELEFFFPLKTIDREDLIKLFGSWQQDKLTLNMERLDFDPVKGFMKGFIDLLFVFKDRYYIVDWKSNFLGASVRDYGQDSLKREMVQKYYTLQYHIYTVAVDLYLKQRIPDYTYESHFGGIFYIFLRGVDPTFGSEFGIFRDRPSQEFVDRLTAALLDTDKFPQGVR